MKKILFLFLMGIICTLFVNNAIAANKVAIFVEGPIDEAESFIMESRVGAALNGSGVTVLERTQNFLDIITKEQSYQLSGEVSPREVCQLGERWGATAVIAIYVVESRGTMVATAKIINVKTGRILGTISNHRVCRTMDDFIVFAATLGVNIKREIKKYF